MRQGSHLSAGYDEETAADLRLAGNGTGTTAYSSILHLPGTIHALINGGILALV